MGNGFQLGGHAKAYGQEKKKAREEQRQEVFRSRDEMIGFGSS